MLGVWIVGGVLLAIPWMPFAQYTMELSAIMLPMGGIMMGRLLAGSGQVIWLIRSRGREQVSHSWSTMLGIGTSVPVAIWWVIERGLNEVRWLSFPVTGLLLGLLSRHLINMDVSTRMEKALHEAS